jgi:hypothetical protein
MTPTRALRCGDSGSTSHRGRSHDRSRSLQAHRVHCGRIAFTAGASRSLQAHRVHCRRIAFTAGASRSTAAASRSAAGTSRSRQAHRVRDRRITFGAAHRVRGRRIAFAAGASPSAAGASSSAAGASSSQQAHCLLLQAHRLCHRRIASAADARWPIDRSASPRIAGNRAAPKLKRARQRRAHYQADDPKPRVVRAP